jgi:hypothetical protein
VTHQRQVVEMVGKQHERPLSPTLIAQKLQHVQQFLAANIQCPMAREPARSCENMAKTELVA